MLPVLFVRESAVSFFRVAYGIWGTSQCRSVIASLHPFVSGQMIPPFSELFIFCHHPGCRDRQPSGIRQDRKQRVVLWARFCTAENMPIISSASMLCERAHLVSSLGFWSRSHVKYLLYWRSIMAITALRETFIILENVIQ